MKLFNTLTRKTEEFIPLSNEYVTIYSCGPTVYNYAHIGNMRTYIFMDLLRRTLIYNGYKLKSVMNITDVGHLLSDADDGDDKMELTAKQQQKTPLEIADFYTKVFFDDLKALNILTPEIIAKATDNINEMIDYVQTLDKKGYCYRIDDGVYFDVSKFKGYGKLSGINLDEQKAGARVEINTQKRTPADFALWKIAPKNHIMKWPSPFGVGFPGWHIECSAMSKKYLGEVFDIHTGGVDHIPIHHENEIAQSEALEQKKTVNYWLHGEFLLFDSGKMSKSLGNVYTVGQLEKMGYSPMAFRYFCLNAHYRKKLNFTFEALDSSVTAYKRLCALILQNKNAPASNIDLSVYEQQFDEAVNADLNIPLALGILWDMLKNRPCRELYDTAIKFDKILGLMLDSVLEKPDNNDDIPLEIKQLADLRIEARKAKDYAKSDELRNKIEALGYIVKDSKDGYVLEKKNK